MRTFLVGGALFLAAGLVAVAVIGSRTAEPPLAEPSATSAPATAAPGQTADPAASPTQGRAPARVWFARVDLPPAARTITAAGPADPSDARMRISSRVAALWGAQPADVPAGAFNAFHPDLSVPSNVLNIAVTINGDLATVEIGGTTWGYVRTDAEVKGLVQQLVYTITEDPGIRRAKVTEPGKDHVLILTNRGLGGGTAWNDPLTREQVAGYTFSGTAVTSIESGGTDVPTNVVSWRTLNDQPPGLGSFSVEIAGGGTAGGRLLPRFTAALSQPKTCAEPGCVSGKWLISLSLFDAAWPAGQAPTSVETFDSGPIRAVSGQVVSPSCGPGSTCPPFSLFALYLDDARPWRVSVQPTAAGTTRVNVDVGGKPEQVTPNIAVYTPYPNDPVGRSFVAAGAARVFEATVAWRVRDAAGREVSRGNTLATFGTSPVWGVFEAHIEIPTSVTGTATLEIFWLSPKDGAELDLVKIPIKLP